ncbi:MAG TPA: 50S ribosomal protein L10 [Solirubrobacteraceae bacterium]|jgi:large subunit ribosomal protein L10|nr:50S ribosomal protein L10 [Solirubrobacteraceae bacterium]
MNREQKSAAIAEIAGHIDESQAIFAVDYRGISVAEIAELRSKLREADATFKVVKNSLTERAADQVGAEQLKEYLAGPTALTFVRGDIAVAAKAVADYGRATQLLPFKGGLMEGAPLDVEQIRALSRLPAREVLYGQLVGVVASPIGGLVRSLGNLLGGLAVALGQVREKKESGEISAGAPPAEAAGPAEEAPAAEAEAPAEDAPAADAEGSVEEAPAAEADAPAQEPAAAEDAPAAEAEAAVEEAPAPDAEETATAEETPAAEAEAKPAEPADEPAQETENQADVSADEQPEDAETSPKED